MYYKISRLILTPTSGKPSTTADIFIANPQIDQEAILGKLFFLGEIESTKPAALKIINFFISALPTYYYQNEKISLREKMGTINIGEIFEAALGKINAEFENWLKKEKVKIEPKTVNLAAGVIFKNELVFSATGKIKVLLIYPENKEITDDSDKKAYKLSALEERQPAEKKVHLHKIFTSVTEGKIPPEGYLIFSNEILPEYVNNRHLTKIITTLPPVSAIEHLKNQLHKINSYVTFLALIIKSSAAPLIKRSLPQMQVDITASDSLERMNATESVTEKYLSPIGAIPANRYLGIIKRTLAKITGAGEQKFSTLIRDKVFLVKRRRLNFLTKFNYHLANFGRYVLNFIFYLARLASHPRELGNKIIQGGRTNSTLIKITAVKTSHWFFGLPLFRKWLLTIFFACVIFFGVSIVYSFNSRREQTQQQSYQELSQLLTQKQNQIEASLLYRNEERARELIDESAVIIEQLKQLSGIDQVVIEKFMATNAEQTAKISHVIEISNPSEIANFRKLNEQAEVRTLLALEQRLIVNDLNNHSLYQLNLGDKTVSVLKDNLNNVDFGAVWQNNQLLFVSASGGAVIDDKNNISEITDSIASSLTDMTAVVSYNSRFYLLSAPQNNIFRYTRNFSSREPWIKENIDIKNAISFDIDGYVYILKNNGEIIKLLSGYVNEFKLSEVNPTFTNPTKIRLTGDSEKGLIYILEPAQTRLVVFEKSGQFLLQYKLPALTNLKDFAVLEKERKIILLNDASIYEIKMEETK